MPPPFSVCSDRWTAISVVSSTISIVSTTISVLSSAISVLCSPISSCTPRFGPWIDVSVQFFVASLTSDPSFQSRIDRQSNCLVHQRQWIHVSVRGSTVSDIFWRVFVVAARERPQCIATSRRCWAPRFTRPMPLALPRRDRRLVFAPGACPLQCVRHRARRRPVWRPAV
jgi:hypothetical protein